MVCIEIQLTEEQAQQLEERARDMDVSLSELIRRGAERVIADADRAEKWRRASAIVGIFHDSATDVGRHHDDYLDEAYSS